MPRKWSIDPVPEEPPAGKAPPGARRAVALDRHAVDILVAVLGEIEVLRDLGTALETGATRPLARLRDLGIPYGPNEWFDGPLSPADRKAYSRAAARLEGARLILRVTQPNRDRVTHLQLTAAGLRRALRLVGRRADVAALTEGLGRTTWGKGLVAAFPADGRRQSRNP